MLYVNMRDKFMSGWGGASGGTSYYCIECPDTPSFSDMEVARAVHDAATDRDEMRNVAISCNIRRKRSANDHVSLQNATKLSGHWTDYMPKAMREELQAMRAAEEAKQEAQEA